MNSILKSTYKSFRNSYSDRKSYIRQYNANSERQIRFYNWWNEPFDTLWLYRFITNRHIVPENKILNFISVCGRKGVSEFINDGPTIFFTGENIHDEDHLNYADYLLTNKNVNLALGFDFFETDNYLRFPLWIPFLFPSDLTPETIISKCEELRYPVFGERNKFASLIARYDWRGTRTSIMNALSHIGHISCPSLVNHNDDDLKTIFGDNKINYLRQFIFNICPENTNSYGYVTEKAFEAIAAGCIPIYWGSNNRPEDGILNHDAMILWNMNGDNTDNIRLIEDLMSNPNHLKEFWHQPRLKPNAEEKITDMINNLVIKINSLF